MATLEARIANLEAQGDPTDVARSRAIGASLRRGLTADGLLMFDGLVRRFEAGKADKDDFALMAVLEALGRQPPQRSAAK